MSGLRERQWFKDVLAAWERLRVTNGNLYAAAITYFTLLALFPLLLLAASIAGFVLHANPDTLQTLFDKLSHNAPGQVGATLHDSIVAAINARTSLGIIGLAGVLLTGLGWIGNLRAATDAVWERQPTKQNPVKQRVVNLGILAGLGPGRAGLARADRGVVGVRVRHPALARSRQRRRGWAPCSGSPAIVVAGCGDVVIFFLVLTRLPHAEVPSRYALRGAILAAVGFEVLKIVGTFTVALSAGSATAGPFAGLLAVLIWVQLVARWVLFCTAWTAELSLRRKEAKPALPPVAMPAEPPPAVSPAAVGMGLVGAGAVAGAAVAAYTLRHRQD